MYIYAGKCVSEGDCVRTLTCCWVKIMLVQKYTSVGGVALQLNGAVCWKGQQLINDDSAAKKSLILRSTADTNWTNCVFLE